MKKNKYLTCLISFIIAVLLISISGTAMFENSVNEEKTLVFEKNKKN